MPRGLSLAEATESLYRPPTPVSGAIIQRTRVAQPSNTPASLIIAPTPTPICKDNLVFQEDLTIPDGSIVQPGEVLVKKWRVLNDGTCNWDGRYRLQLVAGPELGVETIQALYPARSGTIADIQLEFKAPEGTGPYNSAWQAHSPTGQPFGDPIYIQISVP